MRFVSCLFAVCSLLLFCTLIYGQSVALTLSSGSVSPGGSVSLPLSIANGGVATAAVQWTISYSPTDFSSGNVAAGPVASSLKKNLSCNSPAAGRYDCILWALDANALTDGALAVVNLTAANTVSGSPAVALTNSVAAAPDAQPIPVTATGATLTSGPTVTNISCSPSTVVAPGSTSCTVTLSGAAPAAGAAVSLGYGQNSSVAVSAPPSVTVPAGATSATFTLGITGASSNSAVQIAATLNGSSASFSLQVLVITVTVSPATVSLNSLQQQQFTAAVTNTTNTAVTWSLNPSVGSISSSGLYTPPAVIVSQQTVTVIATSAADPTKNGTATVTLVPLLGL